MGWITAFSMAFGMFCAIPFPGRRWDERQRARMLVCFPWVGAIIGAVILGMISNGLDLLSVNQFYRQIIVGAIIIIAVAIDVQKYVAKK